MALSSYSEHATPISPSNLMIVFFATPVMRTMLRIEHPSTRAEMTWQRLAVGSLFILTIMLEQSCIVNVKAAIFHKRLSIIDMSGNQGIVQAPIKSPYLQSRMPGHF